MIHNTYLIQRLKSPRTTEADIRWDSVFSFGCVKQGGFTDKGWQLINRIFSFDYMGSSEFEWGTVPRALSKIVEWSRQKKIQTKTLLFKKPVYCIYNTKIEKYVFSVISDLISDSLAESKLKERCGLQAYIKEEGFIDENVKGWIELDNNFMFFIERKMFEDTCKAFNIKIEEPNDVNPRYI